MARFSIDREWAWIRKLLTRTSAGVPQIEGAMRSNSVMSKDEPLILWN
ncbi:MAG: hypothetical protein GTO18_08085 [Anaerolineales bacterium]|nr:hypothetical protein [Anaerolineales bacterium]